VLAVLAVGAVISARGRVRLREVVSVANIAAPWMVLVFIAFGLIGLRQFIDATGTQVTGLADVWTLAQTQIWKGGDPLPGQVKFTFWHVMFFAWFCNMAMHIGMSDLSVLRFAKKSWYGMASGAGMFLGHFLAWLAASILYAFQLHQRPEQHQRAAGTAGLSGRRPGGPDLRDHRRLDDRQPDHLPGGPGLPGDHPQVVAIPRDADHRSDRHVAAMFPALAMKLLDFVALYGLILMPMGAVVFVDFWLIPKLGLQGSFAQLSRSNFNWAAGAAWIVTLVVCLAIVFIVGRWTLWFVALPGWFIASAVYIMLSRVYQRQAVPSIAGQVSPGTAQA
jgi:hypothetical protein